MDRSDEEDNNPRFGIFDDMSDEEDNGFVFGDRSDQEDNNSGVGDRSHDNLAQARITEWINNNNVNDTLYLDDLNLRELPTLPPN